MLGNGFYFLGATTFNVKDYSLPVAVVGRVCDDYVDYGYSKSIVLDDVKINGKPSANVRLVVKGVGEEIEIGDLVAFESMLEKSRPFTLNSFNSSDLRDGVRYHAQISNSDLTISKGYKKIDESVRQTIKSRLFANMSEKNAGICYAVLFGDKSGIDDLTETAYKNSGIIHVLTVSGLHVSFLISLVFFVLKLCKANKWTRFALTTFFIFCYAFLCGFTPSVLRAGVMAVVFMLSKIFGRRYDSLNSLGIAGFVICLFSPLSALDLGFQMSFFCVAGIIMLAPTITKFLSKFIPNKIAGLIALSISAQIGVLPIMASFGSAVNILSVVANLLIVPAFSVLYPLLFVVSFVSALLPFVGRLLIVIDYAFVCINAVANFFASSGLTFSLSPVKTAIASLYFIAVMVLGKFLMAKSFIKFFIFSFVVMIATISFCMFLIPSPAKSQVCIIGNSSEASVVIENKQGERLVVGQSFMLTRFLNAYGNRQIDGFIALDYVGEDDFETLSSRGVQSFWGGEENLANQNFRHMESEIEYLLGQFKFKIFERNDQTTGVMIFVDGQNIFVASGGNIDYNYNIINSVKPSLVLADDNLEIENALVVSKNRSKTSDYSLSRNGNMKFKLYKQKWIMRGLD